MWALTVELSVLLAHEPLNPTASAWVVSVWLSNWAVCSALIERLETSRLVPGPVLSAMEAEVPPPVLVFAMAAAPATTPPLPETAWAKLMSSPSAAIESAARCSVGIPPARRDRSCWARRRCSLCRRSVDRAVAGSKATGAAPTKSTGVRRWSPTENFGWESAIVTAPLPGCGKVPPEVMSAF